MTSAIASPARRLTGRHVLFIALGFFGTIASADAFLIYSAVRTWTGAETTSAYKAGQLYNRDFAEAQAQAALGWRMEATVERDADGLARIRLEARDRRGEPLAALSTTATLQRPTDKRADRSVALAGGEGGVYLAAIPDVAAGQWDLVVEAQERGARVYRRKTRHVLP